MEGAATAKPTVKCSDRTALITDMIELTRTLLPTRDALRETAEHLEIGCVAPPRELGLPVGYAAAPQLSSIGLEKMSLLLRQIAAATADALKGLNGGPAYSLRMHPVGRGANATVHPTVVGPAFAA